MKKKNLLLKIILLAYIAAVSITMATEKGPVTPDNNKRNTLFLDPVVLSAAITYVPVSDITTWPALFAGSYTGSKIFSWLLEKVHENEASQAIHEEYVASKSNLTDVKKTEVKRLFYNANEWLRDINPNGWKSKYIAGNIGALIVCGICWYSCAKNKHNQPTKEPTKTTKKEPTKTTKTVSTNNNNTSNVIIGKDNIPENLVGDLHRLLYGFGILGPSQR